MRKRTIGRRLCRMSTVITWTVVTLAAPRPLLAQTETGSVAGVVSDETGAPLPGVTVTVVNLATGQSRTGLTNERGRYQIAGLQPSRYSVTAELTGFGAVRRPEVTVNLGAVVDLDVTMKVASIEETVTVSGQAPLVQSTKTAMSTVITQESLESLPSRSRQYLDFTLLLPTATESSRIQGTGADIGGARSKEGTLLVDGFYNLDEQFNMPKQRHSQDSVQEFQVVTFGGAPEYGRAIGGVINVITKSGGNIFSGSGYGYFRNEALNSQDFLEKNHGLPKSEFRRQQWGGTTGGPLRRDRSFFFAAYERLKENIPFDNGIKPEEARAIGLSPSSYGTQPRFLHTNFAMFKWDHNLSANHRLQASVAWTQQEDMQWSGAEPLAAASTVYDLLYDDLSYVAKWQAITSGGRMLHEARASHFPRFYLPRGYPLGGPPLVPEGQINSGGHQGNASPPLVDIAGVARFGSGRNDQDTTTYPFQTVYSTSIFKDKHSFKVGADYMYVHFNNTSYSSLRGQYNFRSLADYLIGNYSQYTQSFGNPFGYSIHQNISYYIQDSWALNKRLTLNYGVRHDIELNPKQPETGIPFGNDYNNVGPRFAASYDLTNKGRTFLKMSSGLYYDRVWQNITGNFPNLKQYQRRVSATWTPTTPGAPKYPQVFADKPAIVPTAAVNVTIMPDEVKVPQSAQFVGTVEHALTNDLAISVNVLYSKAWFKEYRWDTNLAFDNSTQRWIRIDPNYRAINQTVFGGPAKYLGGTVDINKRGARLGFNVNLTVQRADETLSTGILDGVNDQRVGILGDYGPAADVPRVRGVFSGWYNFTPRMQLSGSYRARTGGAVDPRAAGLDLNGDAVFGDRTPTLSAFSFRGPGMNSADLRYTHMVPVGDRQTLRFYVEAFNFLNTASVKQVLNNYGANPASPGPQWLQPANYFPPREIQLGLRFTF